MEKQKADTTEKMIGIYFKLMERERQIIEQKMALAGVHNMSAYIRKMCIDGYIINLQIPELSQCSRYLHSAPNNVNQIVKRLNSGGQFYAGELSDVKDSLNKNEKLFGSILEKLAKITSINLDCTRKFRNFWRSSFVIRKLSDMLCLENGLSVIEELKPSRGSYADWLKSKGINKPPTVRQQLERIIDDKISQSKNYDEFLNELQAAGVEIKQGKNLALKLPGAKRFVRCNSLSDEYSEQAIKARLSGKKQRQEQSKPNLLIDIQSKMQQANAPGYELWAKKFNLKEMAKTVMYLQENNLLDYEVLLQACAAASEKYNAVSAKTKANSERMNEISQLQKHIGAYRKTKDVYAEYRKLAPKKQAAFYEQHRRQIVLC